jgi:hypothetical protein
VSANRGKHRIHRLFTASAGGSAAQRRDTLQEASSLKTICPACAQGPSRVDGHPGLRVQSLGASRITFTCRHCDSVWSRNYVHSTAYAWEQLATSGTGVFMPGVEAQAHLKRRDTE